MKSGERSIGTSQGILLHALTACGLSEMSLVLCKICLLM